MKILMTGATGLIGREVGKRLVASGHTVSVVVRSMNEAATGLPFPCEIFEWKSENESFPISALRGVSGVINLAGEPIGEGRWTDEKKRRIHDSRVVTTAKLVEAIQSAPVVAAEMRVFVQGSAVGFYGDRGDEVLDEGSLRGNGFLADVVRDWEDEADHLIDERYTEHVRVAKIRTAVVFSRHGGAMGKLIPLFSRGLGGKLGSGQQWMSWIHLDDIARLFVFAIENENVAGVINGAAPEPLRNERFTVEFARALGKSVFLPVPAGAIRLALGEMAATVLASQRVVPKRALELGFEFQFPEVVTALKDVAEPYRNGEHEFLAEQWIPKSPDAVFPFFCSELNLEDLTPPFLNFKVVGKSTDQIGEGTLIDYRLSIHGVPMKWRTRIDSWKPGHSFVDTQLAGPYEKWQHTHEFVPFAGGTLMRDRVQYKVPLGLVGDVSASWKVDGDVKRIFEFRRRKIGEMFGVLS